MAGRGGLKDSQSVPELCPSHRGADQVPMGWGRFLDPWEPPLPQL